MFWLLILEKFFWFGIAGTGFAVLFNVPLRTLFPTFIMAAIGGTVKTLLLGQDVNVILASLFGATLIGFLSIFFAHRKHSPPPIFAIPAVIPMVPGIFAYKMMLGLIKLSGSMDPATYQQVLTDTVGYGLKVMFILMSLAAGVGIPLLVTRKESAKQIRLKVSVR